MTNKNMQNEVALVEEKVGYKKTKLGWIPEDWLYSSIRDFINQLNGFAFKSEEFNQENKGTRLCRGINITRGNLRFDEKNEMYWDNTKNINLTKYLLEDGDIVISMDGSLVGRNYSVVEEEFLPLLLVQRVARLRTKTSMSQSFLFHWISSNNFIRYVDSVKTSSGIPHISAKDIYNFAIAIPPLPEQQKIATILNTWDKAIAAQEKLIAQKQDLKKGLMQQLLTGKKRFAGFEKKWNKVELREIGTIIRGASPRPKGDPRYYGGNVPRLMVKDVTRDGKYVTPKIDFLTEAGAEKSRPCKAGTLTVVCSGDVGVPSFLAVDACIHDGFLAITDLKADLIDADFLYYQLKRLRARMERSATHGGVFTNLTTTILKDFIIKIPTVKEQLAIINVLSKADREVDQQKLKLKKITSQKRGLMQQLLTGNTRVNTNE